MPCDGEASLLGGRSAAASKTASRAEKTETCFICEDIGFRRCLGDEDEDHARLLRLDDSGVSHDAEVPHDLV